MKSRKRKARVRKRKALKRRARIAPYIRELQHSKVLPSVIRQVAPLMSILIESASVRRSRGGA
jgi:hypothetical protein